MTKKEILSKKKLLTANIRIEGGCKSGNCRAPYFQSEKVYKEKEVYEALDEYAMEVFKWVMNNNLDFSVGEDTTPEEILKEFQVYNKE